MEHHAGLELPLRILVFQPRIRISLAIRRLYYSFRRIANVP
jgi:hypothetical protein